MENDPAVRAAVRAGYARFGTIDARLLQNLTRGGVWATDFTNASRTLFFDINTLAWDRDILTSWGLADLLLPPAFPSQHPYGKRTSRARFPGPCLSTR
jgi:glycerol kinase